MMMWNDPRYTPPRLNGDSGHDLVEIALLVVVTVSVLLLAALVLSLTNGM